MPYKVDCRKRRAAVYGTSYQVSGGVLEALQ
jgi:hypothetical protein